MQKECALDADFGVRTGCKQECALEHPSVILGLYTIGIMEKKMETTI